MQRKGEFFAQSVYVRYGLLAIAFLMAGKLHGKQTNVIGEQTALERGSLQRKILIVCIRY